MKFVQSLLMGLGGLAAAGALLTVLSPRAHAVAAAMVDVTNMPANPVMSQSVPTLAPQIVTLVPSGNGPAGFTGAGAFTLSSLQQWSAAVNGGGVPPGAPPFVVPAGQSLVVTSLDVAETAKGEIVTDTVILANAAVPSGQVNVSPLGSWVATLWVPCALSPSTTQFRFSPGLVFSAGQNVWMTYNAGLQGAIFAEVHGYLSFN